MVEQTVESVQVFVDLSNVAKDELLGYSTEHAALSRWDRLRSVWLRERPQSSVTFVLIADASLGRALSAIDRVRLSQLVARREAIVVPDADVEVLRRAVATAGIALSNDRYVDHRRTPGLDRAQLVSWVVRGESIRFQQRSLERLLSAVISARAQKQALKELGLTDDAPELQYRWFCENEACANDLVALPRVAASKVTCPECGAFLDRGPTWQDPIWLKVMHAGDEVKRFVLEDGDSVYLGRGVGDDTISLADRYEYGADVIALDERHVELANEGGRLKVRDNSTGDGTSLRLPGSGQRNLLSPPVPVSSSSRTWVTRGAKVVLGRTRFTVQISGGVGLS